MKAEYKTRNVFSLFSKNKCITFIYFSLQGNIIYLYANYNSRLFASSQIITFYPEPIKKGFVSFLLYLLKKNMTEIMTHHDV